MLLVEDSVLLLFGLLLAWIWGLVGREFGALAEGEVELEDNSDDEVKFELEEDDDDRDDEI